MCLLKHTHDYSYAPFATFLLLLRAYRYVPILRAYCYTFCYVPATTRLSLYEPTATRLSLCAYCYAPITTLISLCTYPYGTITLRTSLLRLSAPRGGAGYYRDRCYVIVIMICA